MSHPIRVRGLKYKEVEFILQKDQSHPIRVRGLKSLTRDSMILPEPSHPIRVRGLKLILAKWQRTQSLVAPHTGAWIEIKIISFSINIFSMSHPIRVRGLKFLCRHQINEIYLMSHPIRVRGLKFDSDTVEMPYFRVAPHTGAWIEI